MEAAKKHRIDRVLEESKLMINGRFQDAFKKLNSVKGISEKAAHRHDEVLFYLAVCYSHTGQPDKAITTIEKSIELHKDPAKAVLLAQKLSYYGNILDNVGNYEKALEVLNNSLKLQSRSTDKSLRIFTYIRLGNVYRKFLVDTRTAITFYLKALKLSKDIDDKFMIASSLGSIGNSYLYLKDYKESRKYYLESEKLFGEIGNVYHRCVAMLGLGTIYRDLGQTGESIDCLEKALSILKSQDNKNLETSVSLNLAISYLEANDSVNAKRYYDRSMSLIKKVNDKVLQSKLYQGFSEVYASKKDFENAYSHFLNYHKLYAETFKEEAERVNKMLKLKHEKEKSEKEAEIYRLRSLELKREVESKTKELNAMASYLSQKNEFVKSLVENVKKDFNEMKLEEQLGNLLGNVVKKAESASNLNEDLKRFETELDKFSFDFIEKLSKKFPSLTRVELKICSMIKINLSTKEIANLLYLSTRTVESHKYNIYKKVKLKSNQNIVTFLNSI